MTGLRERREDRAGRPPGPRVAGGLATFVCVTLTLAPGASTLGAQEPEGSTVAAMATATLGLYSGSALALTGTLVPCSQVTWGLACSRVAAVAGAVVGAISGGAIGAHDRDRAVDRLRSAGIGAVAGGLSGFILRGLVRQYGWVDAGAGAALGMAVGASGRGSAYGFAAGAIAGALLWQAVPSVELADAVGLSLAGLAVGGLGGWVHDALRERQAEEPESVQPWLILSIRLR